MGSVFSHAQDVACCVKTAKPDYQDQIERLRPKPSGKPPKSAQRRAVVPTDALPPLQFRPYTPFGRQGCEADAHATFEGMQVVINFWTAYESETASRKLCAACDAWNLVSACTEHPEVQPERFEFARLQRAFQRYNRDTDAQLSWASGEVRSFVRNAFEGRLLRAPPLSSNAWCMMYSGFAHGAEGSMDFDFARSVRFLVHVAGNIFALAKGEAQPVEVAPDVFMIRRPENAGTAQSAKVRQPCETHPTGVAIEVDSVEFSEIPVARQSSLSMQKAQSTNSDAPSPASASIRTLEAKIRALRERHRLQDMQYDAEVERRQAERNRRLARKSELRDGLIVIASEKSDNSSPLCSMRLLGDETIGSGRLLSTSTSCTSDSCTLSSEWTDETTHS